MRLWPRSIFGRLLAIATISTLAALLFAAVTISHVLERVVMHGLDDRLDAQVAMLARAVRPDGTLDPARTVDLPGFGEPGSGWAWRVSGPGRQVWTSGTDQAAILLPAPPEPPRRHHHHERDERDEPRAGDGRGPGGDWIHARTLAVATPAGAVTIMASGPRRIVDTPIREAMLPLLASLALLGAGLALATLAQLRLGLRPLKALRAQLARVRAGDQRHIPGEQPTELVPLVAELNALIDQNEAGLASARQHVANLAHGLKTPLAALAVKLAEPGRDPDGSLGEMVRQIDGRVRHHLGRARAAAPGGGARVRTPLGPALADLVSVLCRIHADRPVRPELAVAADLAVAVDPQDLDEMLGNLLDNAWRHAGATIRIEAVVEGAAVILSIEDDGPGLDDAAIGEALMPGRRLDERGDGHGFGLPIARELAELHGGRLALARSARTGGLVVRLELPAR